MKSDEIRLRFLKFFEERGHKIIPSSSLIPENDSSVLFTTAGMQQFKKYYLNPELMEKDFGTKNVASAQKCVRTSDIDEVGDNTHLTFFEMLGNFSFGGYGRKEAIQYAYEFITKEMNLEISYVTIYKGNKNVPRDDKSEKIWQELGLKDIREEDADVFWGPTGDSGPCGPTTEIYCKSVSSEDVELWNIVFNEYFCNGSREQLDKGEAKLEKLPVLGVDTGMGFERLVKVSQDVPTVFETDLFLPIMKEIPGESEKAKRIIADHIKSSVFLISEGILPSNVERGYVLRRLIRRAIRYGKLLNLPENFLILLVQKTIEIYKDVYIEVKRKETEISTVIQNEEEKFEKTLEEGLKQFEKLKPKEDKFHGVLEYGLNGEELFNLYSTYGFPIELSLEEIEKIYKSFQVEFPKDIKEIFLKGFYEALKKHQELSRTASARMFKGGLAAHSEQTTKYHTATHLLLAALRQILGQEIYQKGSNITAERLRFDFNYPQKLTDEQIKKIEDLVNQKIQEDLEVKKEEMSYEDALESGALAFFKEKYPEKVSVYSINDFSKEICAGPHTKKTSELGHFKIQKEESSGAGVRRIRAILE